MNATAAGLPLPRLSRGRFSYPHDGVWDAGSLRAFTDDALYDACGVRLAFTERSGGFSVGPYASLNLADHVADDVAVVEMNRAKLLDVLGVPGAALVVPHQVHGTSIVTIESHSDEAVDSACIQAKVGADAIVVGKDACGVAALLCYADCMPVVIVAPDATFAVIHAGWRGVDAHIVPKALELICAQTGARADCCNVYIGPYIHGECFEVGDDVHVRFIERFGDVCAFDAHRIDMGMAMKVDLARAGVLEKRIADADACTMCSNDRFFSYRAQGGVCGRHGALAVRVAVS